MAIKLSELPKEEMTASPVSLSSLKKEKKTFLGSRPGIDDPKLRRGVGHAITVTQIGAPIVAAMFSGGSAAIPTSVATAGAGEYLRSLAEGRSQKEALKSGAFGAVLDLALGGATKVKHGVKALKGIKSVAGAGAGIKSAGEALIRSRLAPTMGEEVVEKIVKDVPKYTKGIKKTYPMITEHARKVLKETVRDAGKAVGAATDDALKSKNLINTASLKKEILDVLGKERVVGYGGVVGRTSPTRPLKLAMRELDDLGKKATPQQLIDATKNIDGALSSYYKAASRSATPIEKSVIGIRHKVNKVAMDAVEDALPTAKKKYVKIMNILDDEKKAIRNALESERGIHNLLEKSFQEGDWKTLKNLHTINDLLPAKKQFMNDFTTKLTRDILTNKKTPYFSKAGGLTYAYTLLPRLAAKGLRGASTPVGKAGMQATKTVTRRGIEELKKMMTGE